MFIRSGLPIFVVAIVHRVDVAVDYDASWSAGKAELMPETSFLWLRCGAVGERCPEPRPEWHHPEVACLAADTTMHLPILDTFVDIPSIKLCRSTNDC